MMGAGSEVSPAGPASSMGPTPPDAWGGRAPAVVPPSNERPAILNSPPDALTLLGALGRRWLPAALLGPLAAAVAGAVAWYAIPPSRHVARAMLHVAANQPNIIFPTQEVRANFDIYKQTQLRLIRGRSVLSAVLRDPEVRGLDLVRRASREGDPMAWLEREVQADYTGEVLNISMGGDGPGGLATLVNAVAGSYLVEVVNVEADDRRGRHVQLQKIYADYSARLKQKRAELEELAGRIGSADRSNVRLTHALALENRSMMERELLRLRMDLRQAEIELAVHRESGRQDAGAAAAAKDPASLEAAIRSDALVVDYSGRIGRLNTALTAAQRPARNADDPSVRRPEEEIKGLTRLMRERVATLRRDHRVSGGVAAAGSSTPLEDRVKILGQMEQLVAADVKGLSIDAGAINQGSMSLEAVQNEIAITEAAAKRVGGEVEALNIELDAPSRVRLIEPADTPRRAADTRLRSAALAGSAAFALVAAGLSYVEFRTRRVRSADEVVRGLGLRLIGTLPPLPRRPTKAGVVPGGAGVPYWHAELIEAVDNVRTSLIHSTAALPIRSLVVTSAVAGEGKTSLACHLATSIAHAGRKTLLLDGDLRCPVIHGIFDVPARPGFCEVLRGEAEFDAAVHPAAVRDLWVLAAGRCDDRALTALARGELGGLIDRLLGRFDFIVVDASPVLPIADAALIARHTDASVQAVLNGVSSLPMVYAAHERLRGLGIRTLGVVVAGVRSPDYGGEYSHHRGRTGPASRAGAG